MNKLSPPSSNQVEDQDSPSMVNKSEAGLSLHNQEESKTQFNNTELNQPQGLYLPFSTAQTYSIMKNIPPEYRLIEKSNLKKTTTRKRTKVNPASRQFKKNSNTVKPRSKRQRGNKKTSDFISSEYIDTEEVYLDSHDMHRGGIANSYPSNPRKRIKVEDSQNDNEIDKTSLRHNPDSVIPNGTFDETNNIGLNRSSRNKDFDNFDDQKYK